MSNLLLTIPFWQRNDGILRWMITCSTTVVIWRLKCTRLVETDYRPSDAEALQLPVCKDPTECDRNRGLRWRPRAFWLVCASKSLLGPESGYCLWNHYAEKVSMCETPVCANHRYAERH